MKGSEAQGESEQQSRSSDLAGSKIAKSVKAVLAVLVVIAVGVLVIVGIAWVSHATGLIPWRNSFLGTTFFFDPTGMSIYEHIVDFMGW